MQKLYLFLFSIFFFFHSYAQFQLKIGANTLTSTGESMPFWLVHNQNGVYEIRKHANQLAFLDANYQNIALWGSPIKMEAGVLATVLYASELKTDFNQAFLRLKLWNWQLEGGMFTENKFFGGLSSTNGHIDHNLNARPYPRIRFGTQQFIPFLIWKNWFSFRAEYDEGLLNDTRTVENTRLHHKALHIKAQFAPQWSLMLGLDHFVMWGGISPQYGQLPDSFNNYLTYVTGGMGNSYFPLNDQLNVAGNQLGSYRIEMKFPLLNKQATFYINHPFDDHSGMELYNWEDNLYGLFVEINDKGWLQQIIWEYLFTTDQSGHLHIIGYMTGRDNYYNNSVYISGFTYDGMALSSPVFAPIINNPGQRSFQNNRIKMHHIGAKGNILHWLDWTTYLTYSKNFGTFGSPYEPFRNQFSGLISFNINHNKLPFEMTTSFAADIGQLYEHRWGMMFGISKSW